MSDEQQLDNSDFGIRGIEKASGYVEMPSREPAETGADNAPLDTDNSAFRHLSRQEMPEAEELFYQDKAGEKLPDNLTIEPKRGANDIDAHRRAKQAEIERAQNEELNQALDYLKQQVEAPPQQQPQQAHQPAGIDQPQPEAEAQYQREQAAIAEADKSIDAVLADPWVRQRIETEFNGVKAQAAAEVQQHAQAYQAAITQNAVAALAVLAVDFPEYAGMSGAQLEGALKVSNPQRAEAYRQRIGQVNTVVGAYQQEAARQQDQQKAFHAQQYQQAQETFNRFAAEQDARVLANDPPETVSAIRNGLLAEAKAAGISEKELITVYNTNSAMRHSFVQNLIADGMRYRLARQSLPQHRANPIPGVQRPGVAAEREPDAGEISSAMARFNRPGGNVGRDGLRNAAALITARRARS